MTSPSKAREAGDALWQHFWAGGVTDPLVAVEQISYLVLLKALNLRAMGSQGGSLGGAFSAHPQFRWQQLQQLPDTEILNTLKAGLVPFLVKAVGSRCFAKAMHGSAALPFSRAKLARVCIETIDRLDLGDGGPEAAAIHNELLDELLLSGRSGQLRTPSQLVEAMVDLVDPQAGEVVCDPALGTGAFLVEASRRVPAIADDLIGFDQNASMVRLALINLIMHGVEDPKIANADTLSRTFEWPAADVVVTHPPAGGSLDRRDVHPGLELATGRSEVLYFELCRRLLRPRGRAAILVPEGLLFGSSGAYVEARRRWLTHGRVEAVISLPSGIVDQNANVRAAILVLTASEKTELVWFGQVEDSGEPGGGLEASADLRHLASVLRWRMRGEGLPAGEAEALAEKMWSATIEEIGDEGWSLWPMAYRHLEGREAARERDPLDLLGQAEEFEVGIQQEMASARALLEKSP